MQHYFLRVIQMIDLIPECTCLQTRQRLVKIVEGLYDQCKGQYGRDLTEEETRTVEDAEKEHIIIMTTGRRYEIPSTSLSDISMIVKEYRFFEEQHASFVFSAKYEERRIEQGKSQLVRITSGFCYVFNGGMDSGKKRS